MAPHSSSPRAQTQANGTRSVVPAIPLPLTRLKSKRNPKIERQRTGQDVIQSETAATVSKGQEQVQSSNGISNGDESSIPISEMHPDQSATDEVATPSSADTKGSSESQLNQFVALSASETTRAEPAKDNPEEINNLLFGRPLLYNRASERSEARQIRTELPPAFVPSVGYHTPHSATSSSHSRVTPSQSFGHSVHPSASNIVFGAMESQSSSPAHFSASSAFSAPQLPALDPVSPAHYTAVDRQYDSVESHPQAFPTNTPSQSAHQWTARPNRVPTTQPALHGNSHAPAGHRLSRDAFTSVGSSRGYPLSSRSGSHSYPHTTSFEGDRRLQGLNTPPVDSTSGETLPPVGPSNAQFPHPDITARIEGLEALREHINLLFGSSLFNDCQLHIVETQSLAREYLDGHRVILNRSPALASMMKIPNEQAQNPTNQSLAIHLSGRFMRIPPFLNALRYLYGGPVLSLEPLRLVGSPSEQAAIMSTRMETALQHAAAGAWLKLPGFVFRGLDVAFGVLRWDTLELALAFVFESGFDRAWSMVNGNQENHFPGHFIAEHDSPGPTIYEFCSMRLLNRITDYAVQTFPHTFYLDAAAPELNECLRLPIPRSSSDERPIRADPRLSQIRFGDIPAEDLQRPSLATTTISSVLLSLPFVLLQRILEHGFLSDRLGSDTVASVMRQVVAEREARRVKVFRTRASSSGDQVSSPYLVDNLNWEEFVEPFPQYRAGFRLARHRVGAEVSVESEAKHA